MPGRHLLNFFLAVVVVAVLATIAVGVFWQSEMGYRRLRNAVALSLATTMEREVQVGEISGNLLTGFVVENVALAKEGGFAEGVEYGAARVEITYSLLAALRGQLTAPAAVKRITVEGGYGVFDTREEETALTKLFEAKPFEPVPPEEKFQPLILVQDSVLDLIVSAEGRTIPLRLVGLEGYCKINAVGPMEIAVRARSGDGSFRSFSAEVLTDGEERFFAAQGRVEGVSAERIGSLFLTSPEVRIDSGDISSNFQLWIAPDYGDVLGPRTYQLQAGGELPSAERVTGFEARVEVRDARVRVRSLGAPLILRRVQLQASPDGVSLEELSGSWLDSPLSATGHFALESSQTEMSVRLNQVDLTTVESLLPAEIVKSLPVKASGRVELEVAATGPLDHLNAQVTVRAPESATVTGEEAGGVTLAGTTVQATVLDSAAPALTAQISATRAYLTEEGLAALRKAIAPTPPSEAPPEVQVGPVQGWHASVLWAGKQALVEGEIGSVSGSYDGSEVRELGGRFHWAGNTLRAEGWRAGVLGGTLNIEGLVHLPDGELEQAEVYLSGGGESLDLAQLPAGVVALLPEELSGEGASELSGVVGTTFSAHWGSERGEAIAELDMRTTRLAGYEVERVQGLVMAELGPEGRWSVELPAATVRGAGFRAAIRGRGSPDTLDVAVELAGADLSQLGIQVKPGERELSGGRVYGAVELEGSLEAPRLSGDLAIFEAEYGLPQPASAVVRFTAQPKSLAGKDLIPPREATVDAYVSYDSALVRVNGEIRRPATELEAPSLQGDVRVAGLQLPAARELVGEAWPEKYALEGLASFAAQLSGTTLAPVADGNLSLTQVQYQDYYLEAIHAPWHGELSPEDEEYLTVRGGHVLAQGARLDFDGSLHEAFDDWNFEVRARAADVRLERMAALQQIRLPMAGEVLVPDIVLRGSAQGISGEGRVLADHVTLGQETLTGVDMHMVLTPGRLTVERARLGAAGGQVETQLTHDLTTQQVRGEMRVQEVAASPLLRIIAVLVASRAELDGAEAAAEPWIRLSVQTRGKISGEVDFSGPIETPAGEISLTLTDATYLDKALPEAKARARYDVAEGAFDGIEAELQIGQGLVVVSGEARLDGDLDLTADASNLNLAAVRDWYPELWARFSDDVRAKLPRSLDVGGLASMVVVAEGSTRSPRLTASLDVVSASVQGVSFDLLSVPVVKIAEGGIDLTGILVKRGEREITGSGHLPFTWQPVSLPLTEPISFNARIANADLGLLPTIMQELQATAPAEGTAAAARPNPWLRTTARGMVNASLSLGGTLETPVLEGFASLEEGAFSRGTWPAPLSDLEAKVTIRSLRGVNRLEVEHASGRWDEVEFKLSGDMDLNSILTQELERNRYNLALTVATPEPQSWSGTMVSELHGRLALVTSPEEGHVLRLEGLGAQLGEGTVRGEGTVKITNWAIQSFGTNDWDMRVVAERAQVVYGGMFRGELEGALEITNPEPGETAVLAGTMTLQRAVFGLPEGGVAPSGPIQLAVAPRNYPPLGLHVNVGLGDDVRFQSAGVTAPLTPTTQALVLRGTIQAPEARGTVGLAPGAGRVTAGNLALASGVLSYASELPERRQRERTITITYRYDVLAEQTLASANVDGREMGPVYLTMRITGTDAAPPAVEVESEPPLTTDQILALVGFASFMPGGTTNLDQLLSQRVVSLLASGLREALLAPIEEELTRSLGLQEFSVMLTFDQPLQVTMGKYLVKNLMVNYRYTYVSAHDIRWNLGLSYQLPSKRNLVTFATNQSGDIQLRVSHSWSF